MKLTHFRSPFFDMADYLSGKDFEKFEKCNCITNPDVNIIENEKDYEIEVAIPGLKKEDFKINLSENILSISSEISNECSCHEKNYTSKEFAYGSFSRSFTLPKNIDTEKISANYEQGILQVVLPLKPEETTKLLKEITVK
ncbi:MAG: Hsp20/alpha crystallin family protein [Bacteroidales bacterium]|nr:Hsp20/alpha crystallin family protein [Bacteroidales bacterium]